jgi:hypothetical protein
MMELRGWQVAFAGIENFILINTALSVVAFIVAYLLRRARLIRSWHPRARARVCAAALAVPPVVSAWFATRNGIMLITHYRHLTEEEGVSFRDAIVQGSMERLSPILMTALVTGVGLIPLALGAGEPGREIQQPMAVVILGGIVTSTFLNMIVIPALSLKIGQEGTQVPGTVYSERKDFASAGN